MLGLRACVLTPCPPLQCDPKATTLTMLFGAEVDICKYRLILASKSWCDVDPTPVDLATIPK